MNKTISNTIIAAAILGAIFTWISTFRTYGNFEIAPSGQPLILEQRGFPFVYEVTNIATSESRVSYRILLADYLLHIVFAGSLITSIGSWHKLNQNQ